MLQYARSDTHFLLDIYDHLRIGLHAHANKPVDPASFEPPPTPSFLLQNVFDRSTSTSSSVFEIPPYDSATGLGENGWRSLLSRWNVGADYERALAVPTLPIKTGWGKGESKLEVLRAVHFWREKKAREEDEGVRYVLKNEGIWVVVEREPTNEVELMAALGSARGGAGDFVRACRGELVAVVREAMSRVTIGEGLKDDDTAGAGRTDLAELAARGVEAREPEVRPVKGLWDPVVVGEEVEVEKEEETTAMPMEVEAPATMTATAPAEGGKKKTTSMFASVKAATSSFFGRSSNPTSTSSSFGRSSNPTSTSSSASSVVATPVSSTPLATGSSSFFGKALPATKNQIATKSSNLATTSSSFFGSGIAAKAGASSKTQSQPSSTRLQMEAVAKIHESLVLGGGLANVRPTLGRVPKVLAQTDVPPPLLRSPSVPTLSLPLFPPSSLYTSLFPLLS